MVESRLSRSKFSISSTGSIPLSRIDNKLHILYGYFSGILDDQMGGKPYFSAMIKAQAFFLFHYAGLPSTSTW